MTRTRTPEGHLVIERRKPLTVADIYQSFTVLLYEHADCKWSQVGRCVYCDDHGVRLYQGDMPKEKR